MKKRKTASAIPLDIAIKDLVQAIGIDQKLIEYEAVSRWKSVVGAQIARETTPMRIQRGVLVVAVRSSVWRNELHLRKAEIIQKLNTAINSNIVTDIKFQ